MHHDRDLDLLIVISPKDDIISKVERKSFARNLFGFIPWNSHESQLEMCLLLLVIKGMNHFNMFAPKPMSHLC